jgi:sialic acid synthase SpsE
MKTKIIAEIAQGYEGDAKLCERFVKLAKQCGADGVKFQIFEAEELCLPNYKYYDLFKSLYLEPNTWKKIIDLCNEIGIEFYADIFGTRTLEWMLTCKIGGVKIHSTDLKNYELLNQLKDKKIRIVVGVGGSTLIEIKKAISYLGDNEIIVMSGFQAEPNLIEDIELHKLNIIKSTCKVKVGYADHIEVTNPLTISLPAMAVLKGADYIEKHLTIERDTLQLEDYISALNPSEFTTMVKMIRDVEQFPNPNQQEFDLTEREKNYRKSSKKVILAATDLMVGHTITSADITMLRTGEDYDELLDLESIIGKIVSVAIPKHKIIRQQFIN